MGMNTRIRRIGVAIILLFLASRATLALARGGGGVGGSLGGSAGRSFGGGSSGGGLGGAFPCRFFSLGELHQEDLRLGDFSVFSS